MTVIGRDRYSEDMIPGRRYRPAGCPWCKATNLDQAANQCRAVQTPSGDYTCPTEEGYNPFGVKFTADGQACQLTNKSAKAEARLIDEWVDEMIARDERKADR